LRLNSDVAPAGSFSCSNEMFNRIQEIVDWTLLSNLFSVESDCPHREKFGYGGDIMVASGMAMFNFDMASFYTKAVHDLADAARPNGGFTETAPFVGIADKGLGQGAGPVEWGSGHPWLVWQLYQYYGDKHLLEEQYGEIKSWLALLQSQAKDEILGPGISDHESLVPKPEQLDGTAFYYFNAKLFSKIARTLSRNTAADNADLLAEKIKTAFNKKFLQAGTGRYERASQACQAYALYFGLVPANEKPHALDVLVRDITETHQGHLTTGIFGTKYMLNALSDSGRADVAYRMVNQKTFPGWGHMIENGATTLWEHWEYSDNTYSHNHPMFGSVSEWFYKVLAGINPAPDAIGFDKIIIRPQPVGDLKWVKASYNSIRGKITSEWNRAGESFELKVSIPANTRALVYVPASDPNRVKIREPRNTSAALFQKVENNCAVFSVGSGSYQFVSTVK